MSCRLSGPASPDQYQINRAHGSFVLDIRRFFALAVRLVSLMLMLIRTCLLEMHIFYWLACSMLEESNRLHGGACPTTETNKLSPVMR